MRIDDTKFDRLADRVERFENMLTNYDKQLSLSYEVQGQNKQLVKEVQELKAQIASTEYRSKATRATELDVQEQHLKNSKKLEYDKGFADAYVEITKKMRAQS